MKKILLIVAAMALAGIAAFVYLKPVAQRDALLAKGAHPWPKAGPWTIIYVPAGVTKDDDPATCLMTTAVDPSQTFMIMIDDLWGYSMSLKRPQDITAVKEINLSVDDQPVGSFFISRPIDQHAIRATIPFDRVQKLFDLMNSGGKVLTVTAGEASQTIALADSEQAIANFHDCIEKAKQGGVKFPYEQTNVEETDKGFAWLPTSPWILQLHKAPKPGCNIFIGLENSVGKMLFLQYDNDKGYQVSASSLVSANQINLAVDGQSIGNGLIYHKLGPLKIDQDTKYMASAQISQEQIQKLFDLMRKGGKTLTVDAGAPLQFALSHSDEAVDNFQACIEKAKSLGGGTKP